MELSLKHSSLAPVCWIFSAEAVGPAVAQVLVLDELTVHLDSEKRLRLRDVPMRLSRKMPQVVVITHDEEIFEGAEARVLRFEMENGATKVTELSRV